MVRDILGSNRGGFSSLDNFALFENEFCSDHHLMTEGHSFVRNYSRNDFHQFNRLKIDACSKETFCNTNLHFNYVIISHNFKIGVIKIALLDSSQIRFDENQRIVAEN